MIQALDKTEIAIVNFDGGAVPNPGRAAGAAVIQWQGKTHTFSCYLGDPISSNVAEYNGLLLGLKAALKMGVKQAKIYGDSQLIISQLNGVYKVRKPHLRPLYQEVRSHLSSFVKYELLWIPREQNTLADAAVNECIEKTIFGRLDS